MKKINCNHPESIECKAVPRGVEVCDCRWCCLNVEFRKANGYGRESDD